MSETAPERCGYVTLAGRPNVGKSTLMNHLLGRKLGITSRKPQTTRQAMLGILNRNNAQLVFVDTPGIHPSRRKALNRYMAGQTAGALAGVDLALMLVEAQGWQEGDEIVLRRIAEAASPCICVVNKVDRLARKERLLPLIDELRRKHDFEAIVPVSALRNIGLDDLADAVAERLPERPHLFAEGQLTDRPLAYLLAEIIREKAVRRLGAELPHQTAVEVERITREADRGAEASIAEVHAVIYVERETQKRIAIGKGGAMLKSIREDASRDIAALLRESGGLGGDFPGRSGSGGSGGASKDLALHLWVKVAPRWSDSAPAMQRLGYR